MGRFKQNSILIFLACMFCWQITGRVCADQPEKKTYKLSLEDVTRLALENNFEIQLAKYDAWIARTDEGVAESIYDTIFDAEI